ncbi:MAG: phosphoribosylanthranilate isomerase [Pseudomonadota bacterium]
MSTLIKICGLTSAELADAAVSAGADALGINFVPGSPREVPVSIAREVVAAVDGRARTVALFANAPAVDVHAVAKAVGPDWLQFHGQESADYCRHFRLPWLKALPAQDGLEAVAGRYPDARGYLVDAVGDGHFGGSGERFDWSLWPSLARRPASAAAAPQWFLAGGLTPSNVGAAVRALRPDWVDVSSGVEGPQRGLKCPERMRAFVAATRAADEDLQRTR